MTVGEAKKFLSPVRKGDPVNHGSPRPVGANERFFHDIDTHVLTGWYDAKTGAEKKWGTGADDLGKYQYTVYDNSRFCSSWAPAVTSAMSLALSIHHGRWVNLSVQFILDCDLVGDPCVERPPLNAYEQFWRRYVPQATRWDAPLDVLRPPYFDLTKGTCDNKEGCYPGWTNCPRNLVLTGSCEPGETDASCPIYFLYNWRYIKSHLWEVGPVTSSVLVRPKFFTYATGIYSAVASTARPDGKEFPGPPGADNAGMAPGSQMADILGMLDVTIIGWGQAGLNLSEKSGYKAMYNRWWYVIPHLGQEFGEKCVEVFGPTVDRIEACEGNDNTLSGIMRFNRRFDDSSIESQAVGAVPFNFRPDEPPTPHRTGKTAT
jgi:hypothetical protein